MGFNINYAPISAAMLMGNNAGRGQYYAQQAGLDNQFMQTMNEAQRTADQRRATDMQNALGYYDADSRNNLASAQMKQAAAFHGAELGQRQQEINNQQQYHQDSLSGLNQYRGGMLDYRGGLLQDHQDNTAIRQQGQEDKEGAAQQKQDAIQQFDPQTQQYLNATGRLPPSQTRAGADPITIASRQMAALKQAKSALEMPEVDNVLGTKTGRMIPRPGTQSDYNRILGAMQAVSQRVSQMQQPPAVQAPPRIAPQQVDPRMQQQTSQAASGGMAAPGGGTLDQEQQAFQQIYQSLPNGATYMGPDGQLRIKRQ